MGYDRWVWGGGPRVVVNKEVGWGMGWWVEVGMGMGWWVELGEGVQKGGPTTL